MKNKATILVNSCDSYSDIWYPFFTLLNKYWPDCPFDIVINTENKSINNEWENLNIHTMNIFKENEKVSYGRRIKEHLKLIETEYIITLMDDFFIRSKVDTEQIIKILNWMDRDEKIACCSLVHHNDAHNVRYQHYAKQRLDGYSLRPRFCHYAHEMQASVWRRKALISSWKDFESPWEWEGISNIRSFDDRMKYYDKDYETPSAIDYIDYEKGEWSGIRKGKWVKETVYELFKENGIDIDFSIRGFYSELDSQNKRKFINILKGKINEFRCLNIRYIVPYIIFLIRRQIFIKLFKKDYFDSYCSYLRHVYYDK